MASGCHSKFSQVKNPPFPPGRDVDCSKITTDNLVRVFVVIRPVAAFASEKNTAVPNAGTENEIGLYVKMRVFFS